MWRTFGLIKCQRHCGLLSQFKQFLRVALTSNVQSKLNFGYYNRFKCKTSLTFSSRNASTTTSNIEAELAEKDFHSIADNFLENLESTLCDLEEIFVGDFDLDNSQGVLTLNLGVLGTWVINKQTPNRQIWWSSPVSGPLRFHYSAEKELWINTRDSSTLLAQLLEKEIKEKTGVDLNLTN